MNHPKFTCNHINQKQLADRWDLSERTLERWRAIGCGPLFLKIGGRVVYRVEDILAYEEQHLADSTQSRVCNRLGYPQWGKCRFSRVTTKSFA